MQRQRKRMAPATAGRFFRTSAAASVCWILSFILSGPLAGAYARGNRPDPWRGFCDDDDALAKRGVPLDQVAEWNRQARESVQSLLTIWNEGGTRSVSSRVFMVGDSMVGNLYQSIWCAAVQAGCQVRAGNPFETLTSGARYEYTLAEFEYRDKIQRNPVTESIVERHRITCPQLGFAVKLIWVKYWWFDDPNFSGNLNIKPDTLSELTKDADFIYANVGHDVSQPGSESRIWNTVGAIAGLARQVHARRPGSSGAGGASDAAEVEGPVRVFVLERPPKHFVGSGNGTGDHVPEHLLPEEQRKHAMECTCYQPNHTQSFVFAGNAATRSAVVEHNSHTPPQSSLRLGLIERYYYNFLHEPRCLLHRGGGDCLHFLHHPGIWFQAMEEMVAAATATPPGSSKWRPVSYARRLSGIELLNATPASQGRGWASQAAPLSQPPGNL
mmetsp:Transcript_12493/g.35086  ORF Transcript_12493/g.35086 Transcript_12493/m.35086 type:complete len:442 (+) Transcript_12493:110-1435(+)